MDLTNWILISASTILMLVQVVRVIAVVSSEPRSPQNSQTIRELQKRTGPSLSQGRFNSDV